MSEIRIEKKQNNWLPWLMAALFAILAIWAVFEIFEEEDDDADAIEMTQAPVPIDDEALTDVEVDDLDQWGDDELVLDADYDEANYDVEWDGGKANFYTNYTHYARTIELIKPEMGLDHKYTNAALLALANGINSISKELGIAENILISERVAFIKEKAEQITIDPMNTKHADWIKAAAMSAVEAMEFIQQQRFTPDSEGIADMKAAASAISKETLTLEQKTTVKNFFDQAADVMKEWSQGTA